MLLSGLVVFLYSYWADIYRPGMMFDGGWYSIWADQQRYYEQARAISEFRLSAENFFYPILYPLLGSFFIKLFTRDPFLVVNVGLFLCTIGILYLLVEKIFDKQKAIFSVFVLLATQRFIYDFVTPWTTSVTTPLFLASLYILLVASYSKRNVILLTVFYALAFFARIADIVFFIPLLVAYFFIHKERKPYDALISVGILTLCAGIWAFINQLVSGNILGPYIVRNTTKFTFQTDLSNILEKIIGYFANSYIFHRQVQPFSSPIVSVFPFFLLLILFLPVSIKYLKNNKQLHVHAWIALSFFIWLASHIIFAGFAPYTLKNLSAHYAKVWYPVGILYGMYIVEGLLDKKKLNRIFIPVIIFGTVLLIIPWTIQKLKPYPLNRKGWIVRSKINTEHAQNIIDSNDNSPWTSGKARKRGDSIVIDMKKNLTISRLQFVDDPAGAATNFDTFISSDMKSWEKLAPDYTYYVRRDYGWDVVGYMKKGRYIRLILNETSLTDPWIIKEINVFGYE